MRPIRLARIAAEAEGVRLRGMLSRIVTRLILAVIGGLFIIGAVVFAHIAAWYEIRVDLAQSFLITTGILGGTDLFVAVILLLLASRSTPSRVEREAYEVRQAAIKGLSSAISLTQMALPAMRFATSLARRRRA